jgi:hypothetical protein
MIIDTDNMPPALRAQFTEVFNMAQSTWDQNHDSWLGFHDKPELDTSDEDEERIEAAFTSMLPLTTFAA